jgi:hypothetical protein
LAIGRRAMAERPRALDLPADVEPLVKLIEQTPRDEVLEALAGRVRQGAAYEPVLAALLLAACREVQPRPSVGFKFHAVLVVHAVHLLSSALEPKDRWLPVFWAVDYFKSSQARDRSQGDWTLGPVDEKAVPPAARARQAFIEAMHQWDEPAADAAVVGLVRSAKPKAIWELLFRFGARDYRSIGHKAIDVTNTHRVLDVVGWKYAEPALRSLVYALLMHEDGNPATREAEADAPWRRNQALAEQFPDAWRDGEPNDDATQELLAVLRSGTRQETADKVVALLAENVAPQSLWDGLILGAGELLVRQPGIIALHAVTTTRALNYAYRHAREDRTRRLLLLQNASFLPMFRQTMHGRGGVLDFEIDELQGSADPGPAGASENGRPSVEAIFGTLGENPMAAARMTAAYFNGSGPSRPWLDRARRLVVLKGTGPHDYKFGTAALELHDHVSPRWRPQFMGSSVFKMQSSRRPDNRLIERIRTILDDPA